MRTIYTMNAAFQSDPLELLCTAFPGNAILPELVRPKSALITEAEYDQPEHGEDVLCLRFNDGDGFRMVGTKLIQRFIDDCIGPRYQGAPEFHIENGIVNLRGNRFWVYTGQDGVTAVASRLVDKVEYELKDVTKEFVKDVSSE